MSEEKEIQDWLSLATRRTSEKMEESKVFAGIVTKSYLDDPMCALQIGVAILKDKPIFLIVDKTVELPEALAKIAKHVERVDYSNADEVRQAVESMSAFARTL